MGKTKINGVAEVAIYVDDIERASVFYSVVLGLPITASFGESRFLQTGRHSTIILFQRSSLQTRKSIIPAHAASGQSHVALSIDQASYAAWRQRILDHDISIEHEQIWSQGTRSIYFRDPDNNSIELIEAHHYPSIWEVVSDAD